MRIMSNLVDATLFVFFLINAIAGPAMDFQAIFPVKLYPKALIDFKHWYIDNCGDYLTKETPSFFIGIIWVELLLIWPISVLNVFGILGRKPWLPTTCLVYGLSALTILAVVFADMAGSGKASKAMLMVYIPLFGSAILAVFRGLLTHTDETTTTGSQNQVSMKKRA